MAQRINKKFVTVLILGVVILGCGVAALIFFTRGKSGEQLIAMAEEQTQQVEVLATAGKSKDANDAKLRAARYILQAYAKTKDSALMQQYIDMIGDVRTDDPELAQRFAGEMRQRAKQLADRNPQDIKAQRFYLDLLARMLRESRQGNEVLLGEVERKLVIHPKDPVLLKHRALAQIARLDDKSAMDARQSPRVDLKDLQAQGVDDPDIAVGLAEWNLREANRLTRAQRQADEVRALRDEAVAFTAKDLEQHPDDLERVVHHLQVLLEPSVRRPEQGLPLIDTLETMVRQPGVEREHVLFAARAISSVSPSTPQVPQDAEAQIDLQDPVEPSTAADDLATSSTTSLAEQAKARHERARGVLQAYLDREGDDPVIKTQLAWTAQRLGEIDQAIALYDNIRNNPTYAAPLRFAVNKFYREQAHYHYGDILVRLAMRETDAKTKAEQLKKVAQAIAEIEKTERSERLTTSLRGRLALTRGDNRRAAFDLAKASQLRGNADPEHLLFAAQALQRTGQPGAASDLYEKLLPMLRPDSEQSVAIRGQLVELYMRTRQFPQAQRHIDALLSVDAQRPRHRLLQAMVLSQTGRSAQAMDVLEAMDPATNMQVALMLSQLQSQNDQPDAARATAVQAFAQNTANPILLMQAVRLTPESERAPLLAQARAGGIDPAQLDVIERQARGESLSLDERADWLAKRDNDPVVGKLREAILYQQADQTEKRNRAFQQARELDADHEAVIQTGFDFALLDEDFDLAERYARQAGDRDLDMVGGTSYWGRIFEARGDTVSAIGQYRKALQLHSFNADLRQRLARLELKSGDAAGAEDAFRLALQHDPGNQRAQLGLIEALERQGRNADALAALRDLYQAKPDNRVIRESYLRYELEHGQRDVALEARQKIARDQPGDTANRLALIRAMQADEQAELALQSAERLLEAQPDNEEVRGVYIESLRLAGQTDRAIDVARDYVQKDGTDAVISRLTLAQVLLRSERLDESIRVLTDATQSSRDERFVAIERLASLLEQVGRPEQAAPLVRQLYDHDPKNPETARNLIRLCLKLGVPDQARTLLEELPASVDRALLTSQVALAENDLDAAQSALSAGIKTYPTAVPLRLARSEILWRQGEREKALEDVQAVLDRTPDAVTAIVLKAQILASVPRTRPQAIRSLQSLLEDQPQQRAARVLLVGLLERSGQARLAADTAANADDLDRDAAMSYDAGRLYLQADRTRDAVRNLELSVERKPVEANVALLAKAYLQDDQPNAVLSLLETHAGLVGEAPLVLVVKAHALVNAGQRDEGRAVFVSLIEMATRGVWPQVTQVAVNALGEKDASALLVPKLESLSVSPGVQAGVFATALLRNEQPEAAVGWLRRGLEQLPADSPEAIDLKVMLSSILHAQGRHDEAATVYRAVLEARPDHFSSLNNLAYLLTQQPEVTQQALDFAQRAEAIKPGVAEVVDTVGVALLRLGRTDEAIVKLNEAKELAEEATGEPLPATLVSLAEAYLAKGDRRQAELILSRAVKLAADRGDKDVQKRADDLLNEIDRR